MAKDKLLFLSAYLPSPKSRQAGQKTAFRHLRWLAERYEVWFLGFCNEADNPDDVVGLSELCSAVHLVTVTRGKRIKGLLRRPGLPLLVAARWSNSVASIVRSLSARHDFSRVHAEWSQMAEYFELTASIPDRWVSVHDVIGQSCERSAVAATGLRKLFWRWETARACRWEAARYANAGTILTQSRKDADLLLKMLVGSRTRIRIVPPFFERLRPRLRIAVGLGPTLLFWGALGRSENAEAALWLGRHLMPRLWDRLPSTRLIVAGSNPPDSVKALASDKVSITGFVPDPQAVFDGSDLAVLPLFRGAGIKVKVLECLAAGLPVLTGSVGAEGISAVESDGLVVREPEPDCYADTLSELWMSPRRLEKLSHGALAWGERLSDGDQAVLLS